MKSIIFNVKRVAASRCRQLMGWHRGFLWNSSAITRFWLILMEILIRDCFLICWKLALWCWKFWELTIWWPSWWNLGWTIFLSRWICLIWMKKSNGLKCMIKTWEILRFQGVWKLRKSFHIRCCNAIRSNSWCSIVNCCFDYCYQYHNHPKIQFMEENVKFKFYPFFHF